MHSGLPVSETVWLTSLTRKRVFAHIMLTKKLLGHFASFFFFSFSSREVTNLGDRHTIIKK